MKSGTSFFDPTLYKSTLRRFWPGSLALAVVWAVQILRPIAQEPNEGYASAVLLIEGALRSFIPAAAGCIAAMAVYHWLHQSRGAAFMAALPVRREAAFLSAMAAGLTLLLSGLVLSGVLSLALGSTYPELIRGMGYYIGITALLLVCYFGLASLCAVLVGHVLALPVFYAVLLYAAVALESSVRRIAQFLIFGLSGQRWRLAFLSPAYYMRHINERWTDMEFLSGDQTLSGRSTIVLTGFRGWAPLWGYAAAGVVLALIAVALLARRPNESAGDVVALPWLRRLFPWCAALALTLTVGLVALDAVFGFTGYNSASSSMPRVVSLLFLMLLGGFLGWFGAQMLLRKTLRVFDAGWGGWGLLAAVTAALVLCARLDVLGVERKQPRSDQVAYVNLSCWYANIGFLSLREEDSIADVLELQRTVVENKDLFSSDPATTGYGGELSLDYYDRNGKLLLHRSYCAPAGRYAWTSSGNAWYYATAGDVFGPEPWGSANPALALLEKINNSPEAVEQRMTPGSDDWRMSVENSYGGDICHVYWDGSMTTICNLSGREACDLYENALLPDSRDSSLGCVRLRPYEAGETGGYARISLNFYWVDTENEYGWWSLTLTNTADSVRTNAWLEDHGIHLNRDGTVAWWDVGAPQ